MNAHVDPRARLRNIVRSALDGCSYQSSRREGERVLVLEARRPDGRRVGLRFLGLRLSESSAEPQSGSVLRLKSVGDSSGRLWHLFLPPPFRTPSTAARVRIEAGDVKLDIVCEDVEWWEDTEPRP